MPQHITAIYAIVVGALVLCLAGIFIADASGGDSVAKGIKVANIDVGGLTRDEAKTKLEQELVRPLERRLTITIGGPKEPDYHLTAKESQIRADVSKTVRDAIREGRKGGVFARTWRGITGGERNVTIKPQVTYSAAAVDRLVARVEHRLNRSAIDAKADFQPEQVAVRPARTGRTVDAVALRKTIVADLTSTNSDRAVVVPIKTTRPKVTTASVEKKYPVIIDVNRGAFQLTLYKKLKKVKTYPIAVGQAGLETPAGLYKIANKEVNPAWHVPLSAWAGSLAGTVIPGGAPNNPIKSRWLGVYDGVGVHGTSDSGSIGSNASHGCIRMLIPDVEELYPQVPVGSPIYIH
ncbi:MAG: L,D-transpeptidase ErfK/SrfK [Solirubrobacteraceae bacterium]|jgi:lipoprotein-anchoring transpeptidase ErfK/SrfK|nr:L,D-transpeptidase ErfK/SrfK [Solirubrobacteraceae bacterium]